MLRLQCSKSKSDLFPLNFWIFIFFMNSSGLFISVLFYVFTSVSGLDLQPTHKQCFHLLSPFSKLVDLIFVHFFLNSLISSPPPHSFYFTFNPFLSFLQGYLRAPVTSTFAGFRSTCSAATWSSARGRTAAGLWTCRWSRPMWPDTSPMESGTSWVRAEETLFGRHVFSGFCLRPWEQTDYL